MGVEENVRVRKSMDNLWNTGNWEGFWDAHTRDVVVTSPDLPTPAKGLDAHRKEVEGLIAAFPDMRVTTTMVFGQGDWVAAEYVMEGTHTGAPRLARRPGRPGDEPTGSRARRRDLKVGEREIRGRANVLRLGRHDDPARPHAESVRHVGAPASTPAARGRILCRRASRRCDRRQVGNWQDRIQVRPPAAFARRSLSRHVSKKS